MYVSSSDTREASATKKGLPSALTSAHDLKSILLGPSAERYPRPSTPYFPRSLFFATAPAATAGAVRRAEDRPPGHADYTYLRKYGIRDPRGGGRGRARLTAPAVAAAAVAKKWLSARYGVVVRGYLSQLRPNQIDFKSLDDVGAQRNPFFVAERA